MTALCHQNRKHLARGLCTQCYQNWLHRPHLHQELQSFVDQFARIKEAKSVAAGERRAKRTQRRDYIRNYRLEKRYGLTEYDYQKMKTEQNNVCFICEEEPKHLYVDHCHESGQVRKLLCPRCNTLVGYLEKGEHLISKAQTYISEARSTGTDDRPRAENKPV